jgi:hypothetical protein
MVINTSEMNQSQTNVHESDKMTESMTPKPEEILPDINYHRLTTEPHVIDERLSS